MTNNVKKSRELEIFQLGIKCLLQHLHPNLLPIVVESLRTNLTAILNLEEKKLHQSKIQHILGLTS